MLKEIYRSQEEIDKQKILIRQEAYRLQELLLHQPNHTHTINILDDTTLKLHLIDSNLTLDIVQEKESCLPFIQGSVSWNMQEGTLTAFRLEAKKGGVQYELLKGDSGFEVRSGINVHPFTTEMQYTLYSLTSTLFSLCP